MLHRADAEGVVVISQPAHAWVSGQLARAWREDDFFGAKEELRFAAEQHDMGFLDWEQAPEFNPATGLPYTFLEMPRQTHLALWTRGIQRLFRYGRYPALLVSLHFSMLARRHEHPTSPAEQRQVAEFLEQQEVLQTTLQTSLANDFFYEPLSGPDVLQHNQELLSLWDWMSLLLCHGLNEPKRITEVPFRNGRGELLLRALDRSGTQIAVEPWPFTVRKLPLICEGRRLLKTFRDEGEMRSGLRAAAPVMLQIELTAA